MKCTNTCKQYKDRDEVFCFVHGTVDTARAAWDILDESDQLGSIRYHVSDEAIKAIFNYWPRLTTAEQAKELNIGINSLKSSHKRLGLKVIERDDNARVS